MSTFLAIWLPPGTVVGCATFMWLNDEQDALHPESWADIRRYTAMVLAAGLLWPATIAVALFAWGERVIDRNRSEKERTDA